MAWRSRIAFPHHVEDARRRAPGRWRQNHAGNLLLGQRFRLFITSQYPTHPRIRLDHLAVVEHAPCFGITAGCALGERASSHDPHAWVGLLQHAPQADEVDGGKRRTRDRFR